MRSAAFPAVAALALLAGCATAPRPPHPPPTPAPLWIDLVRGEEVPDREVLADLAGAGVIFVGEAHTVAGHHTLQRQLLQSLHARGVPLTLGLEQLEARDQPAIDRYLGGELDFDGLAQAIDWPGKWRNYADYRPLCEFARQHRIPIRGLNAPAAVIRAVFRGGGVAALPPDQRAQLPAEILLDDPDYERLMRLELAVHAAADATTLRPMFEAQAARDDAMAAQIVAARTTGAGPPRTVLAVMGAGHMRYGLGTAARVRRRDPTIVDRLVLVTIPTPVTLSAEEKAASREVSITHGSLRELARPPADYLRVLPRTARPLPPGHPPIPE
jgi:uncharacterized iron-regulated protein